MPRNWKAKYATKEDLSVINGKLDKIMDNELAHLNEKCANLWTVFGKFEERLSKLDNRLWALLVGIGLTIITVVIDIFLRG